MVKRSIIELVAGKHRGNVMSSLMSNFDVARDALETSLNSSGSAMAEHKKWSQSLEAQLNKLKAAWQGLSQAFLSSDFLKTALKAVIELVDGLGKLVDTLGTIPTLLLTFSAFKSLSNKGGVFNFFKIIEDDASKSGKKITFHFKAAAEQTKKVFSDIGLKTNSVFKQSIESDTAALRRYITESSKTSKLSASKINEIFRTSTDSAREFAMSNVFKTMVAEGKPAVDILEEFTKQQKLAQVSIVSSSKSFSSARAIMKEYYSGCKNVGESIKGDFLSAVKETNPVLADAISKSNSIKGATVKYAKSLAGATLKTVGMQIATLALNAAITMGISAVISLGSYLISLIPTQKKIAEKTEEITSKFKEQHDELMKLKGSYDTSNEDSMISKYSKLAKGVDKFGKNVSLTSDEYAEYQDISNKIAEQIPSLVQGFDEQGNAILRYKDNVAKIVEEYENLIHVQNQAVLSNSGTIEKDFKNTVKDNSNEGGFGNFIKKTAHNSSVGHDSEWYEYFKLLNPFGSIASLTRPFVDYEMTTGTADTLSNLLEVYKKDVANGTNRLEQEINKLDDETMERIETALKDAGVDTGFLGYKTSDALEKTLKEDNKKIKGIVENYYSTIEKDVSEQKTIAQAVLSEAFDVSSNISGVNYSNIGENLENVARLTISSLDYKFFESLQKDGKTVEDWTNEMLSQLNSIGSDNATTIELAFDLQTQFNNGEITYGEYIKKLTETKGLVDKLDIKDEARSQLKLSLGLDGDNSVIQQYSSLVAKMTKFKKEFNVEKDEAKSFLDGLSVEEYNIAVDIITEMQKDGVSQTISEIQAAIDREMLLRGLTLKLDIEVEKTKLDALSGALSESVSATGLSTESINAVDGMFSELSSYDPSKLFERTANGIHLNNEEFKKLNAEYKDINIAKTNKELSNLGDAYNLTRQELYGLTYGTDEYNKKAAELKTLEDRINATETLLSQYQGLASAYQEWQIAESSGNQRDMYENIISGWKTVEDEISRGWIDGGTREFLELLYGEKTTITKIVDGKKVKEEIDIATASASDLKKAFKELDEIIPNTAEGNHKGYKISDFFTVDEDGNSTSQGVRNFLDAIGHMEEEAFGGQNVIKRDGDRIIGFDFQMVGGDKVIAEALGVSEELVQIMKRASADAGFVVTLDGSFEQLDVLREKAQLAAETLNKALKKKGQEDKIFSYNFNSTDEKDITKQLEKANNALNTFKKSGEVDLSIEGASEALTVTATLQSMLDDIQKPAYMKIDISQVEDDLQEPLRNLQELRTLTETEHQFKISGTDTSELEGSKQEIYDYFEKLDPNIKAKIGLVDDKGDALTGQALKDKLNSGDIAIEATIDIQMEMDEKLGVLVDKALYEAGIIDEKEFKKRVNVYLEADVDNNNAKEETREATEEVVGEEKTKKSIEVLAEVTGTEDVDGLLSKLKDKDLDDKTIEAVAKVIGQTDFDKLEKALNTFDATDKVTLEVIAQAIGEGDVEKLENAINQLSPKTVQAIAEALGFKDVESLKESIRTMDGNTVQAIAEALGFKDVESLKTAINTMKGKTVNAKVNTDGQKEKIGKLQSWINGLKGKTVNIITNIKKVFSEVAESGKNKANQRTGADPAGNGVSDVNGTAHIKGTAYKQGNWRTKRTETALTGELGRENFATIHSDMYFRIYLIAGNPLELYELQHG